MKKKVLTIILILAIVSVGLFAVNHQRAYSEEGLNYSEMNNPMYVELSDGTYKNVETDTIVSEEDLPEYCQLIGGEGQRNEYNTQTNRSLKMNNDDSRLNKSFSRESNRNSKNSKNFKNSRTYQNR